MRTRLRLLPVALIALAATGCPGCDTTRIFRGDPDDMTSKASEYRDSSTPLKGTDLDTLWEAADNVLRMQGYAIDTHRTKYENREMYTHWETRLAPNRFQGWRRRAIVKFYDEKEDGWRVAVVVQVQRNDDIENPSNPAQARWKDMPADSDKAGIILYRIESGFRDPVEEEEKRKSS
jgi:hypothetical protein